MSETKRYKKLVKDNLLILDKELRFFFNGTVFSIKDNSFFENGEQVFYFKDRADKIAVPSVVMFSENLSEKDAVNLMYDALKKYTAIFD